MHLCYHLLLILLCTSCLARGMPEIRPCRRSISNIPPPRLCPSFASPSSPFRSLPPKKCETIVSLKQTGLLTDEVRNSFQYFDSFLPFAFRCCFAYLSPYIELVTCKVFSWANSFGHFLSIWPGDPAMSGTLCIFLDIFRTQAQLTWIYRDGELS